MMFFERSRSSVAKGCAVFAAVFLLMTPSPSLAEPCAEPTIDNMAKMLVRLGALDIRNNAVIDSYAIATECKIFKMFSTDDFKWEKIRAGLRQTIRDNVASFPANICYKTNLHLDRYDFKKKGFPFLDKAMLGHANMFVLNASRIRPCLKEDKDILPEKFLFILDQPIHFDHIPVNEKDAQILMERMLKDKNPGHLVATRFNLRAASTGRMITTKDKFGKALGPLRQQRGDRNPRIQTTLESIDFFEDEAMTKLIYSYRP